jgi:hypothetical protein
VPVRERRARKEQPKESIIEPCTVYSGISLGIKRALPSAAIDACLVREYTCASILAKTRRPRLAGASKRKDIDGLWLDAQACGNTLPMINHVAQGECWQDSC